MPDASAGSFARAEVIAREKTFDVALVDESDVLFQVPTGPGERKVVSFAKRPMIPPALILAAFSQRS